MRVLAIRGCNLASLAGDFTVDFQAEPLNDAGIFAITGPTGAGKSTLLDAVCLALFGEIPRLSAAPSGARIAVGGQEDGITASDPRLILRHGAGEGFAEVDFATADGARYRATWTVKRARGLPTGKLQNVQQTFQRLDTGEVLGGTKTETLAAIRQAVGLTADQFGRAVLLAQGEFEAFIRAKPDDRALLLERLTGSDIYARLGRKAFEKAQEVNRGLAALRTSIASQNGLDETQRAQAEADLAAAQAHEVAAAQQFAVLNAGREWEKRAVALAQEMDRALDREAQAEADVEAAMPRREALAGDRRAMALVPALTERDRAEAATTAAAGRILEDEAELAGATDRQAQARTDHQAAEEALTTARTAAQSAAAALAAARELDVQISGAARRLAVAETAASSHGEQLKAMQHADAEAQQQCDRAEASLQSHVAWLDTHAALAPLTNREAELLRTLASQTDNSARLAKLAASGRQAEQNRLAALGKWNEACDALSAAAETHGKAKATLARIEADTPPAARLSEISSQRDDLRTLTTTIADRQRAEAAAADIGETLTLARAGHAEAMTQASAARDEDAALAAQAPELQARHDEAARACALASVAADQAAQTMREQLVDGDPCPVCGSTEHRLSALDAILGEQLTASRARLADLAAQLLVQVARRNFLSTTLQVAEAQAANLARDMARLEPQLADRTSESERFTAEIIRASTSLGLPSDMADLIPALAAQSQQADAQLATLTHAQSQQDEARKAEQAARMALDKAQEDHETAREALSQRNSLAEEIARETKALDTAIGQTATMLDTALDALIDWRTETDPVEWLVDNLATWRTHDEGRARASEEITVLRNARAQAAIDLSAINALAQVSAGTAERERAEHRKLVAERQCVLAGEPVSQVETRLNAAIAAADLALSDAAETRNTAAQAVVAMQTALAKDIDQRDKAQTTLAHASETLSAALEAARFAESDLRRVAEAGQQALDSESQALNELDRALSERRALLAKCREDIAGHEASEAPALRGGELAAALVEAERVQADAANTRSEIEIRLGMDDKVRAQTASLRAQLSQAETGADVWLRLNDLLGDATGAKFRRFAQGLTLDRLLEHANVRLADLKPRFTLERASGGDMLIQVIDNDMAGDVRGLHNLSGGERFLVSLALALGLAEMSTSKGVRIESLFIDEGFGALDPKSLGDAIALLEHLHQNGRRVGVISHVEDLKERIPVKIEVTPAAPGRSTIAVTVD